MPKVIFSRRDRLNFAENQNRIVFSTHFDQKSRHVLFYEFLKIRIIKKLEARLFAGLISTVTPKEPMLNGYHTCLLSKF